MKTQTEALNPAARELRETQSRLRNCGQRNGELQNRIESLQGEIDHLTNALRDCITDHGAAARGSMDYANRRFSEINRVAQSAIANLRPAAKTTATN